MAAIVENPTLYAIADAVKAFNEDRSNLRVVSLGVGTYPEPNYSQYKRCIRKWPSAHLHPKNIEHQHRFNGSTTTGVIQ